MGENVKISQLKTHLWSNNCLFFMQTLTFQVILSDIPPLPEVFLGFWGGKLT